MPAPSPKQYQADFPRRMSTLSRRWAEVEEPEPEPLPEPIPVVAVDPDAVEPVPHFTVHTDGSITQNKPLVPAPTPAHMKLTQNIALAASRARVPEATD